jgi:hypothetical protein
MIGQSLEIFTKRPARWLGGLLLILVLTGCASHFSPDRIGDPYGFFFGLWHGAIATLTITINIISWLLSLVGIEFLQDVQIIGRPNTGFFYFVGFALGFFWLSIFR